MFFTDSVMENQAISEKNIELIKLSSKCFFINNTMFKLLRFYGRKHIFFLLFQNTVCCSTTQRYERFISIVVLFFLL